MRDDLAVPLLGTASSVGSSAATAIVDTTDDDTRFHEALLRIEDQYGDLARTRRRTAPHL